MKQFLYIAILLFASVRISGQQLTGDQIKFLQKNTIPICRNEDLAEPEWKKVVGELKSKKIILLGEFTHGAGEIFKLRNDLIKYLHQELGIKTILFESGIGELITAEIYKKTMSPSQMLNGLFGVWRTKEFGELMDYVKEKNISIAGFDVQRSGGSFAYLLKDIAQKKNIDSAYYHDLETRYGSLNSELNNKKAVYDSLKNKTGKLIDDYNTLYNIISERKPSTGTKEISFVLVTLKNRTRFLSYMLAFTKNRDFSARWAARDSAMADNVQWLIEYIYKDEPVIVIGHNYHIARFNEKETVMGEILATKYSRDMYSIGVFAEQGSFHDNSGKEAQMLPPDTSDLDIKHIINLIDYPVSYLPVGKNKETGAGWLDKEIIVNDSFVDFSNINKMVLARCFDGLLFFKRISPPLKP